LVDGVALACQRNTFKVLPALTEGLTVLDNSQPELMAHTYRKARKSEVASKSYITISHFCVAEG